MKFKQKGLLIISVFSTFFVPYIPLQIFGTAFLTAVLLSYLYTRIQVSGLKIKRTESVLRGFCGRNLDLTFDCINQGIFPVGNFKVYDPTGNLFAIDVPRNVLSVNGKSRIRISHRVDLRQRGRFLVGPLTIEGGDPLGFFQYYKRTDDFAECIVYPKVYSLEFLIDIGLPAGYLQTNNLLYEDVTRYRSIREYVPGDSLSHISWKHSAKMGNLYTKEFLPTFNYSTLMILNLQPEDYDIKKRYVWIERMIELTSSLTYYITGLKQSTGLISTGKLNDTENGITFPVTSGEEHAMQILETLACISLEKGKGFLDMLTGLLYDVPWNTRIIYIGPLLKDEDMDSFISLWPGNRKIDFLICQISKQKLPKDTNMHRFFSINSYGDDIF